MGWRDEMYGKRLRELRISLGYTQKQLADRLGISAESVSMYELGKRRPQKEIQKRINHLFCVTDQYFSQETEKDRVEELMHKPSADLCGKREPPEWNREYERPTWKTV